MERTQQGMKTKPRIFTIPFASVYPLYLAKVERKGRTRAELDAVICWLTGHDASGLAEEIRRETDLEKFFSGAPRLNPARLEIRGLVCGVRVEEVEDPVMREIRYLDKLVDELAKGKALDRVLGRRLLP
jgi:hypothetical protein